MLLTNSKNLDAHWIDNISTKTGDSTFCLLFVRSCLDAFLLTVVLITCKCYENMKKLKAKINIGCLEIMNVFCILL